MAQREGSIYLGLFVATFILFAATVVVVFILQGQLEDLESKLANANQRHANVEQQAKQYLEERDALRRLVGGPDAVDNIWPGIEHYQGELQRTEDKFREVAESLDKNLGVIGFVSLAEPYDEFLDLLRALNQEYTKALNAAETIRGQYAQKTETTEETIRKIDQERERINTAYEELQARFVDLDNSSRQKIQELSNDYEELEDQLTELELGRRQEIAFKDNQLNNLKTRLQLLQERVEKTESIEDIEPDGRILDVESKSGIAWVDLGRNQLLREGVVFRVFQEVGGKKLWKGRAEVQKVEDNTSQLRILDEDDALNPIAPNDFVASAFYDRNVAPVFVLVGEPQRLEGLSYVQQKLESLGATVSKSVGVYTDFVVAFAGAEASDELRTAKDLGVTIMREGDLMTYLGR